jgi:hypothetical protein
MEVVKSTKSCSENKGKCLRIYEIVWSYKERRGDSLRRKEVEVEIEAVCSKKSAANWLFVDVDRTFCFKSVFKQLSRLFDVKRWKKNN